jgi:type II secretory pathway pseudopilin PulG
MPLDDSHEAAMILLRALRFGGPADGFTVIELLIAMMLTLLVAGALANVAQPARAAFDRVPAELDLQQRGRTAIDALSQALRSTGKNVAATDQLGSLSDLLPTVSVSDPDESGAFTALTVIAPVADAAQGVLSADQPGPGAAITLAPRHCPSVRDVCGFVTGSTAVIAGGDGDYDVFTIAATNVGARLVTPARALSRSYPAGSVMIEADEFTFSLAAQADGSNSMIRRTAAGAIQPMVDFVSGLSFHATGRAAPAGFFQIEQVEVSIRVEPAGESLRHLMTDRVFRASIWLRNAS